MNRRELGRRPLALALILAIVFFGTGRVCADDVLTAGDWQYLRSIGYEEQSSALERTSTKGQRKYLHKLINSQESAQKRRWA
jgi:hypothetical protein